MMSYKEYIAEAADSAVNLHMTHADEDIYERGVKGARHAIDSINDVIQTLSSNVSSAKNITVKWDGAPAIFAGTDPADGKFFVGKKSVFNKSPKLYKTPADVKADTSGELQEKFLVALKEFAKLNIPKDVVLQGDLMFTKRDLKYETMDGVRYITMHPNTLVYAFEASSDVGKAISNAAIGVIWHTTYRGSKELANYRAKFGADVNKLRSQRTVWMDDAYFKDISGTASFTTNQYMAIETHIKTATKAISGKQFDKLVEVLGTIPSSAVGAGIKTYINSKVRGKNMDISFNDYIAYVKKYYEDKVIAKVKTDKSKDAKRAALKQLVNDLNANKAAVENSFIYVMAITKAKNMVISKLNSIVKSKIFVKKTDGSVEVANPEGYVVIAHDGSAVKFVDRLAFSYYNFSDEVLKGWQK